jgi:hypothetical protein
MEPPKKALMLGIYKHYKGNLYQVLCFARDSETLVDLVVYQAKYNSVEFGNHAIWIRPLSEFMEDVLVNGKQNPRFKYMGKGAK